jgi:hypothetical protein
MTIKPIRHINFGLPDETQTGSAGGQPARDSPVPCEVNSLTKGADKTGSLQFTLMGHMPQKTQHSSVGDLLES